MSGPEHMPLPPGKLLSGRYRVEHILGRGGMGAVYAARDEMLSRPVALKVLASAYALEQELVARFEREARAAAAIRHPGVVQVFDRGADSGILYAVMELLEGEDLDLRLWREKRLSPSFVARMGADLCDAVHAAHGVGVIHRDLKPSNVFLAQTDTHVDVVKVLDFGVAKLHMGESAALTRSNQVFGTVAYMAPEQLEAARNAEPRSDVYAIGCILWEMLAGRRAFDATGAVDLTLQVLEREAPPLANLRGDVPQTLADAITRAMRKQPEARFASAAQFGEALRAVAAQYGQTSAPLRTADEAVPGKRPPDSGEARPPVSADDLTVMPADPSQLAPARAVVSPDTLPAHEYSPDAQPPPTEMQPRTHSTLAPPKGMWLGVALGGLVLGATVAWLILW